MTRLLPVLALAASLAVSHAFAAEPAQPARPNIIFILIDDQRYDALGCAGHPFLKTPNIDRIAREGALFENALVTTPLCSPSRASFLTGQYARVHNIRGNANNNELSHQLITWPALLQKSGYETAWIGKIHMGNDASPRPGFDHWISFKGQGEFIDPTFNINGKVEKQTGYMTDLLSARAVEFIQRKREKPFVLCLSHKAVHGPFTPAERHQALYADEPLFKAPSVDDTLEGKPMLQNRPRPQTARRAEAKPALQGAVQRNQLRCIVSIDEGVGQIIKTLEESKQLDNTLIVYTSDNGYFWGEHKLGDKRAAYEESIRVPLVMRYPKLIPAASRPKNITLNIDLAPTFLQLAGVAIPSNTHGKSLVSLFDGDAANWRSAALLEYFMEERFPHVLTWQAVRTDRWKYIHYPERGEYDELYDLEADKHEMKNLISDASVTETLKTLKSELQRQLDATR